MTFFLGLFLQDSCTVGATWRSWWRRRSGGLAHLVLRKFCNISGNGGDVWGGQGKTQAQIGEIMRWSREAVKNYAGLRSITPEAWQIITVTTKDEVVTKNGDGIVTTEVTTVTKPFTEGLLRAIVSLTAAQHTSRPCARG